MGTKTMCGLNIHNDLYCLPGTFQAVRALMIVGIVLGVIGAMIALFSLKCLKMGSMEDSSKAKMTLTAGVMFIIAGIGTKRFILTHFKMLPLFN